MRMAGAVDEIHLIAQRGGEPQAVSAVSGEPGMGLEGDRKWGTDSGDITLIEGEAVDRLFAEEGVDARDGRHRRNVTVRGIDMAGFVGARFRVGEVECVGEERCEPCSRLAGMLGTPHIPRALVHTGIRAAIVKGGTIRVGDSVELIG